MHTNSYACMHTHIIHTDTHTHACTHTHTHAHTHTHTRMHTHMQTHTHTHTHKHTHTHTHTHMHTNTHTHTTHNKISEILIVVQCISHHKLIRNLKANICMEKRDLSKDGNDLLEEEVTMGKL